MYPSGKNQMRKCSFVRGVVNQFALIANWQWESPCEVCSPHRRGLRPNEPIRYIILLLPSPFIFTCLLSTRMEKSWKSCVVADVRASICPFCTAYLAMECVIGFFTLFVWIGRLRRLSESSLRAKRERAFCVQRTQNEFSCSSLSSKFSFFIHVHWI